MAKALVDKNTRVVYDPERPWLGGNLAGGDPRCIDKGVFNYLIETFSPKTMLDVGCGEGDTMRYFAEHGIPSIGVEGLEDNATNSGDMLDNIMIHDYTKGVSLPVFTDLVLSCEFVEHVHKKFMVNYLPQFLACKVLAFTHAVPNQMGYHHVNCEDDNYWIWLLTSLGMVYLEKETNEARARVKDSFWNTVLIFKHRF